MEEKSQQEKQEEKERSKRIVELTEKLLGESKKANKKKQFANAKQSSKESVNEFFENPLGSIKESLASFKPISNIAEMAGNFAGVAKALTPSEIKESFSIGSEARKIAKGGEPAEKIEAETKKVKESDQESQDELILTVIAAKDEIVDAIDSQSDAELKESRRLEKEAKRDAKVGDSKEDAKFPALIPGAGSGVGGRGAGALGQMKSRFKELFAASFLSDIVSDGLFKGLGKMVAPALTAAFAKNILKFLGKASLFAWLGVSLFQGIKDGWDTWKETGDLSESILSGLSKTLSAMTFGLLSPEDITNISAKIKQAIIDTIAKTFSVLTLGLLSPEEIKEIGNQMNQGIKGLFKSITDGIEVIKGNLGLDNDKEAANAFLEKKIAGLEEEKKYFPERAESIDQQISHLRSQMQGVQDVTSADTPDSTYKTPAGSKVNYARLMAANTPDSTYKTSAGSKRDPGIVLKDTRELGPKSMEMINSENSDSSMIEAFGGDTKKVTREAAPKSSGVTKVVTPTAEELAAADTPDSTYKTPPSAKKVRYDDVQTHMMPDGTYQTFSIQEEKDKAAARRAERSDQEAFGGNPSVVEDTRSGEEFGGGDPSVVRDTGANLGARMSDSDYKQVGGGAFKMVAKPLWELDADGKLSIYLYDDASASVGKSEGMMNLREGLNVQESISKSLSDTSTPPMVVANSNDNISSSVVNNNSFSTPAAISSNHNDRLQSRFTTRSMA